MVATDSYRLSVKETRLESPLAGSFEANVPARALQELTRIVQHESAETLDVSLRAGITRVILPADNERDLEEIPADVREKMEFHLVEWMDEVVNIALDGTIVPLAAKQKLPEPEKVIGSDGPVTH